MAGVGASRHSDLDSYGCHARTVRSPVQAAELARFLETIVPTSKHC